MTGLTAWNPNASTVVGCEWMPTVQDVAHVSATKAHVIKIDSTMNETIGAFWFYLGGRYEKNSIIHVDVYEDNLPVGNKPNVGHLPPGTDVGLLHYGWESLAPGMGLGTPSNFNSTSHLNMSDEDDNTNVFTNEDLWSVKNPGFYVAWHCDANPANWASRRIISLGIDAKVKNQWVTNDSAYVHFFPVLIRVNGSGDPSNFHTCGKGTVLQPTQDPALISISSPPVYQNPLSLRPWVRDGAGGALEYMVAGRSGLIGMRVASPKAFPLQIVMSELSLRVEHIPENRIAYGTHALPSVTAPPSVANTSGDDTSNRSDLSGFGWGTGEGWVGVVMKTPDSGPGFSKRANHTYYFVVRIVPDISGSNGSNFATYGSVDLGSVSISRIGESQFARQGPRGGSTYVAHLRDAGGLIKSIETPSSRVSPNALMFTDGATFSSDSMPYHSMRGVPAVETPGTGIQQDITPFSTVANIQAIRLITWCPDVTPTSALNVTIKVRSSGATVGHGSIQPTDLGDDLAAPQETVVLLDTAITLSAGTQYYIELTSTTIGWQTAVLYYDGDNSITGSGSYGGTANVAHFFGAGFQADSPMSLHRIPAAPTALVPTRVSTDVT